MTTTRDQRRPMARMARTATQPVRGAAEDEKPAYAGGAWVEHVVQSDIGGWVELEVSIPEDERSEKDPLTSVRLKFPHLERVTRTGQQLHDQSVYIAAQDLEDVAKALLLCAAEGRRTGVLPPLEKFGEALSHHRLAELNAPERAGGAA